MEFLSLKILDVFKKLFERLGINYEIMRVILKTKLTLDTRRAPVINQQKKKEDTDNYSIFKGYSLHLIFGVLLAAFIYFIKNEMIRMIYFSGAFFFMTTMYLISDFSFVLLDTKDKNILMTKPIDSKVLSLSKVFHILIYMFRLNAFLAGPSLIAIVMLNGITAIPIFLMEIFLMDLFIFLITAFIYILILRFFDGELLRNIINFIQILLTIVVTIGYQIAIRMINFADLQNITYNFKFSNYFNPILWFGAPFEIVYNGGRETYLYVFTILLIVIPLICFVFYLRLSEKMEYLLLKLEGEGKERPSKHMLEVLVGKTLIKNKTVKQSFYFANSIFRSDRSLKLKIYPAISTGIFLPVLMLFNMRIRNQGFEASGYEYLYLYFSLLIIPTVLNLSLYSSTWKGAYVYVITGFGNLNELYKGIMLAAIVRLFIPLIILNSTIYIFVFKGRFLIDMIALFIASLAIFPVFGKIYFTELPFSMPIEESNQNKNIDKYMMSIGIVICVVLLHVLLRLIPIGIWIFIGLSIINVLVSWNYVVPKRAK